MIRCRPLSSGEEQQGHTSVVQCTKKGEIYVTKPYTNEAPKQFTFDAAYDKTASQVEIY
jgi:hypothetical protein